MAIEKDPKQEARGKHFHDTPTSSWRPARVSQYKDHTRFSVCLGPISRAFTKTLVVDRKAMEKVALEALIADQEMALRRAQWAEASK